MSERVLTILIVLSVFLPLLASCGGGGDVLATVGDKRITGDDFRETFNRLTPEEQVRVLDPGGRMALLERIVHRTVLESECSANPTEDAVFWEDLYSTAWLASEWLTSSLSSLDPVLTSEDSLLFSTGFTISVVLVNDSSDAASVAALWTATGPSVPEVEMALAPWTTGGSSYLQLSGLVAGIPQDLTRIFGDCAGQGVVVRPAFGVWAVGEYETEQIDTLPPMDGMEGTMLFGRHLAALTPVEINSSAVGALASTVSPVDGAYMVTTPDALQAGDVLATWEGGELTAGETASIMANMKRKNFFDSVPTELAAFMPPEPRLSPGVDMWFYISRIAMTRAQADLASSDGHTVPEHILSSARAEDHLRQIVLVPLLSPESDDVLEFYNEHVSDYVVPERRSVMLAYIDSTGAPIPGDVVSFDDLGEYRTMVDDAGEMMPTPLQPADAFGELLGGAVFATEPGEFSGPVEFPEGGLVAYFQVVDVAAPDTLLPEAVWPVLEEDYRRSRLPHDLEAYLMELWDSYSVEIDSSRVEGIDPWARTY